MHNNVKNEKAPTKTENKKKLKSSIDSLLNNIN